MKRKELAIGLEVLEHPPRLLNFMGLKKSSDKTGLSKENILR